MGAAPGEPGSPEAVALADRLRRQLLREALILGIPNGILIAVYYALWTPLPSHHGSRIVQIVSNLTATAGFVLLLSFLYNRIWGPRFRQNLAWVGSRAPTSVEHSWLLAVPRRVAGQLLFAMCVIAGLMTASNKIGGGIGSSWAIILVGLVLVGMTFAALTYLRAERTLRPAYALAAHGSGNQRTLGVRARLLIAWAAGSGIPLLFVLAIPVRGSWGIDRLPVTVPMEFMAAYGLLIGVAMTIVSARSVADPLEKVRAGLQLVEGGDLSVEVAVDDPGEIGQLQGAFNAMVVGLRERRQLQELFGRHVGEEAARHALEAGIELGGETREVSVMFADLVGSTALAESRPPDDVVAVLNQFFELVVGIVEANGGWVDKFVGDGALCVFGAPSAQEEHAARALRSARTLSEQTIEKGLSVGIGLATGVAVAGNIGTATRFEYTVIGPPVNQAARLSDLAKGTPTGVLVSAKTLSNAPEEVGQWVAAGEVELRGVPEPVAVAVPAQAEKAAPPTSTRAPISS